MKMTRKGDAVSAPETVLDAMPDDQRGRLRRVRDLRGRFAEAVAQGLDAGDDALLVTRKDWRATHSGERPCRYDTVVYVELPGLEPLSEQDRETAVFGPTIWSYRSGNPGDLPDWNAWLAQHQQQAGRYVFDAAACNGDIAGVTAALARGLLDGETTQLAIACADERQLRIYAGMASDLLAALGRRGAGIRVVSCPTCARCRVDMRGMVHDIQQRLPDTDRDMEVAIMGCEVNGPGEAKSADVGIAIGAGVVTMFEDGEITARFSEDQAIDGFLSAIEKRAGNGTAGASQ